MTSSSTCPDCGQDEFILTVPTSPVPHLLQNNQPPSALETALLRTSIANMMPQLQRLEEEVARVRCVLEGLEGYRDELRTYRRFHERVLSPVRMLPPEILEEILLDHLADECEKAQGQTYRNAISTLGQVCQYWKQVSHATPQIWARINFGSNRPSSSDISIKKVELWLQRSADFPLTITWPFNPFDSPSMPKSIISRLSVHANRWEDVNLWSDKLCWDHFSACINWQLPLLRTLSMGFADMNHQRKWTIHVDAPLLRSLNLETDQRSYYLPNIEIPFSADEAASQYQCATTADSQDVAGGSKSCFSFT